MASPRVEMVESASIASGVPHRVALTRYDPPEGVPERRPVFCVHGLARNAADFRFLAEYLQERGHPVACIDLPGRGHSEKLQDGTEYALPQYLGDVGAALKHLGWPTIHWVGTSLGGMLAMAYTGAVPEDKRPSRVVAMVLNDIGHYVPASALEHIGTYIGRDPRFATKEEASTFLRGIYSGILPMTEEQWVQFVDESIRPDESGESTYRLHYDPKVAHNFQKVMEEKGEMEPIDLRPFASASDAEGMLIIRGGKSALLSREVAEEMLEADATPRVKAKNVQERQLREAPEAGHVPSLMTNTHCEWVKEFFDKLDDKESA